MKTFCDNSRLEELIEKDITSEIRDEILEILKDSSLITPVIFRKKRNNSDFEGQFGFDLVHLPDGDGGEMVMIYTSSKAMQSIPFKYSSSIALEMCDLAEIIKQSDEYSTIAINPFKCSSFSLSVDEFLGLFEIVADHKIRDIENEKLIDLLQKTDISDDELIQNMSESTFITAWCDDDSGAMYVPTFDCEDNCYFALFTDLNEYKKVFGNDSEVYPQAFAFQKAVKFANDDLVINPASQSFKIRYEKLFK